MLQDVIMTNKSLTEILEVSNYLFFDSHSSCTYFRYSIGWHQLAQIKQLQIIINTDIYKTSHEKHCLLIAFLFFRMTPGKIVYWNEKTWKKNDKAQIFKIQV